MYKGVVRYNGDHYYAGEEVRGSKVKFEDGKLYLFDDEPINDFPYYGEGNDTWVEVESFVKEGNNHDTRTV